MHRNVFVSLAFLTLLTSAPFVWTQTIRAQQPKLSPADQMVVARSMEQPQSSAYPVPMPPDVKLDVLPVLGNVFVIAGAKSNVTVQVGDEGVWVVDTATTEHSAQIVKAIKVLSPLDINYIVNTSGDPDHYGGNDLISKAGWNPTISKNNLAGPGSARGVGAGFVGGAPERQESAVIFAHENTLNRMSAPSGQSSAVPFALWPTNTFFTDKKTISFNDEAIEMLHAPAAHTDGDLMVFFRRSDVVATGDVVDTTGYSTFDPKRGGTIKGVLSALNDVIDITVPRFNQQGGTRVVPGHGRILNEADVVEYRDMTTIIHDRVKLGIDKGMTLAQIKAQKPTLEYDPLYSKPSLTGDAYVELIYNDLKGEASKNTSARSR